MPSRLLIVFVLVVLALLHAYLGWRLLPALGLSTGGVWLGGVLLALSFLLMPAALAAPRMRRKRLADVFGWAGMLAMGLFSSLLVLSLLRDLLLFFVALAGGSSAALTQDSAWGVLLLALLASGSGFLNARRTARVVSVDVPISGLPEALEGFTIAQISDLHVGPTIKRDYLKRIVRRVNELHPDLIAVTGDLADGGVPELAEHTAPLADLLARYGAYFVTGNHDHYSGAEAWIAEVERLGLTVLMNEHVVLDHRGAALVVAGVTDYDAHHIDPDRRSDPHAAIAGAPSEAVAVLLAHQPRSAPLAAKAGFALVLSGHTHGGQFWPWNFFVPLQQPFTAGLHRLDELWVYVSRGTGYWGPPKRFGAPSEITLLRLGRGALSSGEAGAGAAESCRCG
ncbi:metallophosphoesterase [Niveibacterium terrae]|uniref:metallophosphoesterase n=1 Tax=Niveibacterium terrae TaxID=3373598 RepID=UPI003A93B71C